MCWPFRKKKPTPPPQAPVPSMPTSDGLRVFRVTDERDGELVNRGYSYWSSIFLIGDEAFLFVGHADGRPRFFKVHMTTGAVDRLGSLLPYTGTGEGWYWDRWGFIHLCDGPRLHKVDPLTGEDRMLFDISAKFPEHDLWQAHSSANGLVHSATLRRIVADGPYPKVGTVVWRNGQLQLWPAQGVLDESQIDASGRWLLIKEDDDNRIINVETGEERRLTNAAGALGHSDCGEGFAVGENDQTGTCDYLNLETLERRHLFSTWNMGYISVRHNVCLHSGETHLNLVALDGSGLVPLVEHGANAGNDYDLRVKACLDPNGRVATYMSRGAAYLLVLP